MIQTQKLLVTLLFVYAVIQTLFIFVDHRCATIILDADVPDKSQQPRSSQVVTKAAHSCVQNNESNFSAPLTVILLAYQRSGSSFIGEIFNTNPNAVYMFEPLDSVYTSLYGTSLGWNIPTDISSYCNGSVRVPPEKEITAVSNALHSLLTCDPDTLPTETLLHPFWYSFTQNAMNQYGKCLTKKRLTVGSCQRQAHRRCEPAVIKKMPMHKYAKCNYVLSDVYDSTSSVMPSSKLDKWRRCIAALRPRVQQHCIETFHSVCDPCGMRVVKTVRATMASMQSLLERLPQLRVLHLIRDPRAVALSRTRSFESFLGCHTRAVSDDGGNNVTTEAALYCRAALQDIRLRKQLQQRFPDRFLEVIYEELSSRPLAYVRRIYKFLDTTPSAETLRYVTAHTQGIGARNSSAISTRWQKLLSTDDSRQIRSDCAAFYKEVEFDFPDI